MGFESPLLRQFLERQFMKFIPNQRARITKTNCDMDGIEGAVVGVAADLPGMTVFIIEVDTPYNNGYGDGWKSLAITEHCLEAI
jgi:hypothetical protein